ncbi:DNA polymerase lambda [Marchantia polymorpha subsp. ruderalis]|uniref:DNA polymerase lambda n=2 Tax=Marchantia polymorpha TaxID=3197 RepID=A0A176WNC6_MARPO|nr:hypothetical protein AXG93_1487s1150 [Marchantia polymorpha subsp. ruderalis]PTQ37500.1 hypothetical protein MARPO_0057s0101 [Marchantia polymorpha]BBN16358.1 hypothetical protein Mp_7g05700 [Marchantia polymorpha subsp. ruderalis]|eukprot:PTQ37500.1 hypothetical protein MARPO_0057s0101 [Marchantia polymorpha]
MGGEGDVSSLFAGVVAVFLEQGVHHRRLQIWKDKLQQRGGVLRHHINRSVTHIFAENVKFLSDRIGFDRLRKFRSVAFKYEWLEDCLKEGTRLPVEKYSLLNAPTSAPASSDESTHSPVISEDEFHHGLLSVVKVKRSHETDRSNEDSDSEEDSHKRKKEEVWMDVIHRSGKLGVVGKSGMTSQRDEGKDMEIQTQSPQSYTPPNLNKNITAIFDELKNIFGDALGDDRRSFSYYKANSVLEKLPFKITSVEEVKGLPAIGKSMQDQIAEILKTGKSSRLEHFKEDEKVRVVSLFGAVWGIGPSTAQKLYEKGHKTLEDLQNEESLTSAQKYGLRFHTDINKKIPRHEVQEMELLVKNCAESITPGISVLCGGSYRRGKALVGDMDFVVTHPDGKSHAGFLRKLVYKLKQLDFLTEDLTVGMDHPLEERGVDTYFGLCKYPGREQRHRIDLKVYPHEKYAFGLIAWTGNDVLNRRLRLLAEAKGYRLDDHGLFPVTRDAQGQRVSERSSGVLCSTEREVFDKLEFPWLEPNERNL